jgi:putative transposase
VRLAFARHTLWGGHRVGGLDHRVRQPTGGAPVSSQVQPGVRWTSVTGGGHDLTGGQGVPRYRRYRAANHPRFITLVTADRVPRLVAHWPALRRALRGVQDCHPFRVDALVVLPDHCHLILTLPEGESDYASRINQLKGAFSRQVPDFAPVNPSRQRRRERGVWQRRFWERLLLDEVDYRRHFDYLHYNPVKHGYVSRCRDWPYSTFHRCVERGVYGRDWGSGGVPPEMAPVVAGE